ncbi:MAG TPA: TolC family protein, partial [Burkholderiaceae bacterium]
MMPKFRIALSIALSAGLLALPQLGASATRAAPKYVKPAKPLAPAVPASAPSDGTACSGEDITSTSTAADGNPSPASADPRAQIQQLVQRALARNKGLDAATLLAQAARDDWEEARAQRLPTVSASTTIANAGSKSLGYPLIRGQSYTGALSASVPIWDGGRLQKITSFRAQLAESARQGLISSEQQLALQTVSLAMDRSRYQLQIQVYSQYVRKMSCLVEALEAIVQNDRGRASELVQAQKSRMQAELSVEQTRIALRQTEVRLRRYVGDELPPSASYAALLPKVPDLAQMQQDAERAADVLQI